jgi:stress-induced morphogen
MERLSSSHHHGNSSSSSGNSYKYPRKSHLAFEQNEKRFKCAICLQEFNTESLLKEHEEVHVTPYCHFCSKMFKSAKLLRVHHQTYHGGSSSQQQQPQSAHGSSKSKDSSKDDNICHDLTLHKIKEEPVDIVSEPEIENLLNHDSNHLSSPNPHSDFYPEPSKSLGIWRNFTEPPPSAFLDHSSVPLGIKMEPVEPEHDQFDFIINEILKKPSGDGSSTSRLSLVAEEISLHQNFWTQSDQQQDTWICDICSKTFTTKQILQRHRIATHDQNKVRFAIKLIKI